MIKDTIKKYSGITAIQDYLSNVKNAERNGTGLTEPVAIADELLVKDYIRNLNTPKGKLTGYSTFAEASKGINIITSQKQGCCQCVAFSFENIQKKYDVNRGYIVGDYVSDPSINYSLFNVKENAMVGMMPSVVYSEYFKNGFVPYISKKQNGKFKDWYTPRDSEFAQRAKKIRRTFTGKKVAQNYGFFSFDKFESELKKARAKYGAKRVMFRISKQSTAGVKWYNVETPYIQKDREFKYLNGGHSMAGDGEIGVYQHENEPAVYIYESYAMTRFHHLKKSIFDLVVKSWEIYIDVDNKVFTEKPKQTIPVYKRVAKRCYKNKPCRNLKWEVILIQKKLGLKADGIFGIKTEKAVKEFQRKNGLKVDGVVGKITWNKMF